jgi:hypothetical protein
MLKKMTAKIAALTFPIVAAGLTKAPEALALTNFFTGEECSTSVSKPFLWWPTQLLMDR